MKNNEIKIFLNEKILEGKSLTAKNLKIRTKQYISSNLKMKMEEKNWIKRIYSFSNQEVFWLFTIVGSIIIYKYFEMPMTKLREKFSV